MYPSPYVVFKSARQEYEWHNSTPRQETHPVVHPALYVVVLAAAHWHYLRVGKPVVLTHILRTRREQRAIYPDRPGLRSPHEFGRAADLRTRHLELQVAREWEEWINRSFPYYGRPQSATAQLHEVGSRGLHLHLQVGPREKHPPWPETFPQRVQI